MRQFDLLLVSPIDDGSALAVTLEAHDPVNLTIAHHFNPSLSYVMLKQEIAHGLQPVFYE